MYLWGWQYIVGYIHTTRILGISNNRVCEKNNARYLSLTVPRKSIVQQLIRRHKSPLTSSFKWDMSYPVRYYKQLRYTAAQAGQCNTHSVMHTTLKCQVNAHSARHKVWQVPLKCCWMLINTSAPWNTPTTSAHTVYTVVKQTAELLVDVSPPP